MNGNGSADQRRRRGIVVTARRNECNRARVVDAIGIRVNALVQFRRDTEGKRPEKSGGSEKPDPSTRGAAFHWARASVRLKTLATLFCAVTSKSRGPRHFSFPPNETCR